MATKEQTGAEKVRWDLSDLYHGLDDPQFANDRELALQKADAFAEKWRGRIAELTPAEFSSVLDEYSGILEIMSRLGSFAYLGWTTNTEDPALGKAVQESNELSSEISRKLVFFTVEWLAMEEQEAARLIESDELTFYRHYLETSRMDKPHILEEKEEKILSAKSVTGAKAWVRFFDETLGASRFVLDGETLTESEILGKMHDPDRNVRRKASEVFTEGLARRKHPLTYVFNTLLVDKYTNDRLRNYPHWLKARNLSNEISDESVDSLVDAVVAHYPLVQRFYRLKKKLLGLDEMMEFDRYAPVRKNREKISWTEARRIVVESYTEFHPEMGRIADLFFEKRWIDAAMGPGKRGGAYSASTVPSVHPYVFMNYEGRIRDVQTLAHELGHGVHQYLSRKQGILQAGTPLTTAETASVFGEMLVFRKLLSSLDDPAEKLALLVGKIDDTIATVFRQVSMNRFEDRIHKARREEGELTTDRFSDLWMETQKPVYGDSVTLSDNYRLWWSYIPHFVHTPGYVYAYAFGELLVLALYQEYQRAPNGFDQKYLAMLEKGGSEWPDRMTDELGVDIRQRTFWNRGLQAVETMIGEAESLLDSVDASR
ncbi:M3 family oligoendopeptidase [Balneolales bacterium ANBcel1]|nr:M3 family oligoendopeptidase [Balneolales bacterium ANBcel1]